MDKNVPPSRLGSLQTRLSGLAGTLRVAAGLVRSGRPIDLAGLQEQVGVLCAQALDLPHGEGRAAIPALNALGSELAGLEAALRDNSPGAG